MNAPPLPASLVDNPRLDRWISFLPNRTVRIATGKVEMGQGVVTAIGQIAADELDLPFERVVVLSGNTTSGPDEQYTTSSLSVEVSGGSVRLVCAEVRAKALERAALRLNCSRDDLTVADGQFLQNGAPTGQDYWSVAGEIDLFTAPEFKQQLLEAIADGAKHVIVDFSDTTFIDSTTLGVLVGGVKRLRSNDGQLSLVCSDRNITKIFEITGLDRVFTIYPTRVEAVEQLNVSSRPPA